MTVSNFTKTDESLSVISYSKSIALPTLSASNIYTAPTKSSLVENEYDVLKQFMEKRIKDNYPFHTCLTWLTNNKDYIKKYPSDIVADYRSENLNLKRFTKRNFLQKSMEILKEKINAVLRRKTKPEFTNDNNNDKVRLLNLNSNTNKPCGFSKTNREDSDEEKKQRFLNADFSRTYTQEYEANLSSQELSKDEEENSGNSSDSAKKQVYLMKVVSTISEQYEYMPALASRANKRKPTNIKEPSKENRRGLFTFIEGLCQKYSSRDMIPRIYVVNYEFYLYVYPSKTDHTLLLFQRHELKCLSQFMDPFDVMKLINETKGDFLSDRRLSMVQNKCNCHIVLDPLQHVTINGLPHRLITIYSTNYDNIARALTFMEDSIPKVMEMCVFRNELPTKLSRKWGAKRMNTKLNKQPICNERVTDSWITRMVNKRSSANNAGDNEENKEIITQSDKSSERKFYDDDKTKNMTISVKTHINISNTYGEIADQESSSLQRVDSNMKTSCLNLKSSVMATKSQKYLHLKRIKCPALILKNEIFSDPCAINFLFDKFHCRIKMIDLRGTGSEDGQVKLTIVYNSKDELHEFCKALGLCIKKK